MLRIRIRLFLGLLDPDSLVRSTDPDPGSALTALAPNILVIAKHGEHTHGMQCCGSGSVFVLGLLDPDPDQSVIGTYPDPDPSIIKQK